jgi:hypothetical protein
MTRSCIALTLLFLVFTVSLYAIRNAQGQPPIDARFGATRHGICPLLGDDFHRCGFGLMAAHPLESPPADEEGPTLADQLCPLAFLDKVPDEEEWRIRAERRAGRDVCIVSFIPLASSVEPPVDPYPVDSLLGGGVGRESSHWRYLSGHDPLYDAAVYGRKQEAPARFEPEAVLPVELVEACRRPLREFFAWEDSIEANFGYQPAQLDQGMSLRGAARTLAAIPARWHQNWIHSPAIRQLECQLAQWSDLVRQELDATPWLIAWLEHQPTREVAGRPMVTEQVRIVPREEEGEEGIDETTLAPPLVELPDVERCLGGVEDAAPCQRISTRQPLPATQRVLVQSLALSLDQTGILLQNASRQLQELVKN